MFSKKIYRKTLLISFAVKKYIVKSFLIPRYINILKVTFTTKFQMHNMAQKICLGPSIKLTYQGTHLRPPLVSVCLHTLVHTLRTQ